MRVASLELCKELYELSGWKAPKYFMDYDLGFILRRLPPIKLEQTAEGVWLAYQQFNQREAADTPEDAACLLAVELFKSGVLTSEHKTERSERKLAQDSKEV